MSTGNDFILLTDPRTCPHCRAPALLDASLVVDRWDTPNGQATASRQAVVCERCDIDDPATGPLITFLAVHSPVGPDHAEEFAGYLNTWMEAVRAPPDPAIAEAEWQAWRTGEFDG